MNQPEHTRPDRTATPLIDSRVVAAPAPGYGTPPVYTGHPSSAVQGYPGQAPVGKIRSTGVVMLLAVVTLGIYPLYYYFCVHEEMKRHSGVGLGGGVALALAFFVGIASPFLLSSEVGQLYGRRGMAQPVSGMTGLWYFPGMFLLVGPIVWFVKTNGALNSYWRSQGVTG